MLGRYCVLFLGLLVCSPLFAGGHVLPLNFSGNEVFLWTPEPKIVQKPSAIPIQAAAPTIGLFGVSGHDAAMKWSIRLNYNDCETVSMRYRANNIPASSQYLLWARDLEGNMADLVSRAEIVNDGEWHVVTVDVGSKGLGSNITGMILYLRSFGDKPASLWLDYIRCN